MALIKLVFIAGSLFGMGALPWQQHFIGLIAGIVFGVALTLALVPFVSITKYGRHSKVSGPAFPGGKTLCIHAHVFKQINLIWTCMLLHFTIYIAMFIVFYIFPMAFTSFVMAGNGATADGAPNANNAYSNGYSFGGNIVSCDKGICSGIGGNGGNGGGSMSNSHTGGSSNLGGRTNA